MQPSIEKAAEGQILLVDSWKQVLEAEFKKEYMIKLKQFLVDELKQSKVIYPLPREIFSALNLTTPEDVKVVIVGQDPYHGPNQAHGLCFSVKPGVRHPPSLQNIYRELQRDLGGSGPPQGHLVPWASQGVLLLNSILTVEKGLPGSHANKGWEIFTDRILKVLNDTRENIVFLLWGSYAQKKGHFLDKQRHCVLSAPHPSPFSAHKGFLGCSHFSRANSYLVEKRRRPIQWTTT